MTKSKEAISMKAMEDRRKANGLKPIRYWLNDKDKAEFDENYKGSESERIKKEN